MDRSRRLKVVSRFSMLAAAAAALFWTIWYLAAGSVPTVSEVELVRGKDVALPFALSRWWDVLFAAVWAALVALAATSPRLREDDEPLGTCLIIGLAFGLGSCLPGTLAIGLLCSLTVGLTVGLRYSLGLDTSVGLAFGLGACLGFGLLCGLGFGLLCGLGFGLLCGLGFGLLCGLGAVIRAACSQSPWCRFGRWMIAKPKEE